MPLSAIQDRPEVTAEAMDHLHLLLGEWQVLADLGMGDVMLTAPSEFTRGPAVSRRPGAGAAVHVVAHSRPGTAQTAYVDDQLGRVVEDQLAEFLRESWVQPTLSVYRDRRTDRQVFAVPVTFESITLAVLSLHAELGDTRLSGRDLTYRDSAMDLMRMARTCAWPAPGVPPAPGRGAPRVGDGVIRLTEQDRVQFMSPNAVSAVNRVGCRAHVSGELLTDALSEALPMGQQVDEILMGVLRGRMANYAELRRGRSAIMFRSIPLKFDDDRLGAILLCRDVSELRRRERELDSKDATIRETHHRVKNSLQTVSALLRMQARRAQNPEAERGLAQAMGRVETVAMVHDALSKTLEESVDFDAYFARQLRTVVDLAVSGAPVNTVLEGRFGELPGHQVTALALVLNEIVTNAVEHGLGERGGTVKVTATRRAVSSEATPSGSGGARSELVVTVEDDGRGLPPDFAVGRWAVDQTSAAQIRPQGLGSSIVRNLVLGELDGSITWSRGEKSGTIVETIVPLNQEPV